MEKRRWRTRLIVVAVLAVLVLVFGPKKLGWLVPGPDEAVTGYVMYELFSGSGAHDPAGEGLEELRTVLDDTWVLWWGGLQLNPHEGQGGPPLLAGDLHRGADSCGHLLPGFRRAAV